MRSLSLALTLALAPALTPAALPAQQSPARADAAPPLEIGAVAPDFALPGATRYGVLANPVRLSDFKGKTVVLAFFFKARTSG
jgi:thioredoxin-dependent peroxiredoxin